MLSDDLSAMLSLTLAPGFGPTLTRRALERFGSAAAVLQAGPMDLAQLQGVGEKKAVELRRSIERVRAENWLKREEEAIARHRVNLLRLGDGNYPRLLSYISDPPPLLYVQGEIQSGDALALAVVGSRRCTAYGRQQADRLSLLAAQSGLCIVSGGAYGIDAVAHRAALRAGGRTIAVLGSGLAVPYPEENVPLFQQIADGHGAVVSELPMFTGPMAENFPKRNRIVSGLSLGVLVIEAAERSGALITARLAAEEHHREVMALPGPVDSPMSAGNHRLIRQGGASLVTNLPEILQALGEAGTLLQAASEKPQEPDPVSLFDSAGDSQDSPAAPPSVACPQASDGAAISKKILAGLDRPMTLDELTHACGLPVATLMSQLTLLEIRGAVLRRDGRLERPAGGQKSLL